MVTFLQWCSGPSLEVRRFHFELFSKWNLGLSSVWSSNRLVFSSVPCVLTNQFYFSEGPVSSLKSGGWVSGTNKNSKIRALFPHVPHLRDTLEIEQMQTGVLD